MADSINTGTQSIRYPTDYNLKTLNLITPLTNGVVNLMPFMIELNLYEDVYSSTLSGEILIQDALGLISNYTLNGTEFLQVQLQKTTQDQKFFSRNYRIYKIGKRVTGDSNDYEVYAINFCSEEFLLSEQYRISKSYKNKKISEIITDILLHYVKVGENQTKPIKIETTTGLYNFVLPNKKLFETINWLSTYARPADNVGADMLFYENSLGYFFNSLQTLYQQDSYQTYKFDPKNIAADGKTGLNDVNQQLTNASDFEVLEFFDTLNAISNGTFNNKVLTIDPLLRKVYKTGTFDYNAYFASSKKMNKFPLTNNYQNRFDKKMYEGAPTTPAGMEVGCLRLATSNHEEKLDPYVSLKPDAVANDINIEKYVPNRVAQLALANYTKIKITVPGDPLLVAGRTVNFSTYQIEPVDYTQSGPNPTRSPDPFYSGKYLITAVRHIVKNSSYITILEMAKESFGGKISGFNNDDSALKQLINGVQI
jgi:hypothetical protein